MNGTRPSSNARSKSVWRVLAVVGAVTFFFLALRSDVYEATSPHSLTHTIFGNSVLRFEHPWWLSVHFWLRKTYSVGAFAVVVFCAHRALAPTTTPFLRAAVLGGAYSLAIEIGQRIFDGYEPELESALDVACGALGGWLAILIDARLTQRASERALRQSASARLR